MKLKITYKKFMEIFNGILLFMIFILSILNIFFRSEFENEFKSLLVFYIAFSIQIIKDILDERLPNKNKL